MSYHATLLAAATAAAALVPVTAAAFEGRYQVQGTNIDGSPYSGEAEIILTSDSTCEIRWFTGPTVSEGICMRYGNAFAASYVLGGAVGLVIYEILPSGALDGIWTISGTNGSGTETLMPMR